MLVDDDTEVRAVIRMGLEILGRTVIEIANGREAIDCFATEQPGVIIIDQGLPDIEGIEVGRKIKQLAEGRPIAIALLTGSDGIDLRRQSDEVGFDRFFVKPVRIQMLSAWIDECFDIPADNDEGDR